MFEIDTYNYHLSYKYIQYGHLTSVNNFQFSNEEINIDRRISNVNKISSRLVLQIKLNILFARMTGRYMLLC